MTNPTPTNIAPSPDQPKEPRRYTSNAAERAMFREITGEAGAESWAALLMMPGREDENDGLETVALYPITERADVAFSALRLAMGLEDAATLQVVEAPILSMACDVTMLCIVDEDGLAKELEANSGASVFAGQNIVGPALFINASLFQELSEDQGDEDVVESEAA